MYEHCDNFLKEINIVLGSIVRAKIYSSGLTVAEVSKRLKDKFGLNATRHGITQAILGNNRNISRNLLYWQKIYEVLEIEIDSHTFAQLLQESQHFNADFKAKKQAKSEENKRNKQN